MDENEILNREDDDYADKGKYSTEQLEMCTQCNLPRLIVNYEVGFLMLKRQLVELKKELRDLSDKIDIVDRRNIHTE